MSGKMTSERRKRYLFFGKEETAEERCHRMCRYYQGLYPDVPPMSSSDLLSEEAENRILVDVRTPPERSISMISGAVSLEEFENTTVTGLGKNATVVTYCTIGYRSGMEARRLRNKYRLHGRISSLDGIVSYTHAVSSLEDGKDNDHQPRLTDPASGDETKEVHTFADMWSCVQEEYSAKHFAPPMLLFRFVELGAVVVLRAFQRLVYNLKRNCLPVKQD